MSENVLVLRETYSVRQSALDYTSNAVECVVRGVICRGHDGNAKVFVVNVMHTGDTSENINVTTSSTEVGHSDTVII